MPRFESSKTSWAKIVFSRYPQRGRVKTRLNSALGTEGCLELHRALLADTVERISLLSGATYLFLENAPQLPSWRLKGQLGLPPGIRIRHQAGDDLGRRLWNACHQVRQDHTRLVLLGTDSPSLPLAYIASACRPLRDHSFCVGPAADGGYYLLSLSNLQMNLFFEIPWGTHRVLRETLKRIPAGQRLLLPRWYDVDRLEDLRRLYLELRGKRFVGFPVRTWTFLRKVF